MTNRAERKITREEVPDPPENAEALEQPNGDSLIVDGDHRWRFKADRTLAYYMLLQAGKTRAETPYQAIYRGAR